MEITLLYWHWLVLGMFLMLAEIFIPSFTIFWFGLGAVTTGCILVPFAGMSMTWQLGFWILFSCLYTLLWFKVIKPGMKDRTLAGISREAVLGQSGQVISLPEGTKRGMIRFSVPLLGADEWAFICDQDVEPGDRVFVKEVSGNTLIVEKRN